MLATTQVLQIIQVRLQLRQLAKLLMLVLASQSWAEMPVNEAKPFAVEHILLQLSDADPSKQAAVLDVANNLIKHYGGPDMVDIEIIGFGSGIQLYERGNALAPRISSLLANEVRFVVCKNTLDTLERVKGRAPELVDGLIYVQTGVAYMAEKSRQGYVLVRP
jgi:intracellular sulfur oxidation DsrE/DsrF family protein